MLILDRYQATNLFLIRGLSDPRTSRFAFVGTPGDLTRSMPLDRRSWDRGFYAFFPSAPTDDDDPHPFLNEGVGRLLWDVFSRTPSVRIRWFLTPRQPLDPAPHFDIPYRRTQTDTHIEFRNFVFTIPANTFLDFDSRGFTFLGFPGLQRVADEGPFRASTPTDRFSLPLLDDNPPPGEQRAVSAFQFYLEMRPTSGDLPCDFDALDSGLYLFRRVNLEYYQRRFAVFQPLNRVTGPYPTPMEAHLDRLAQLDDQHSFLAFTPSPSGAATVGTHLRTTLGKVPTLAPIPPDQWWNWDGAGWRMLRPRLVFALRSGDFANPPSNTPRYLAPAGRFRLDEVVAGPGDTAPATDIARRLLCGNAGTEYVVFRQGHLITFHPGRPGCYSQDSASLTEENGRTLTSWVSLSGGSDSVLPRYRTQPSDAPLYTPAYEPLPGDPDEGSPVPATPGVFDFQQVPNRELTDAAVFPLAPAAGYRPHEYSDEDPSIRLQEYLWIETRILYPTRRDIINGAAIPELITQHAQPRRVRDDELLPTVTPQGLLVRLNPDDKTYHTLVLAVSEPPDDPGVPDPLEFQNLFRDPQFVEALKTNKLFAVLTGSPAGTLFHNTVGILGWKFSVPFGLLTNDKRSMLVFKFYDRPLVEVARHTDLWAKGAAFTPDLTEAQSALRKWVDEVENGHSAGTREPVNLYEGIWQRINDKDWNGVLAVNVDLAGRSLPEALQGLVAGIDMDQFKANHVGIDANRYEETETLDSRRSSMFALIDYNGTHAEPTSEDQDFGYRVTRLQALFSNSAITQFNATVELSVRKVFKQNTANPDQPVTLVGSYERRRGETVRTTTCMPSPMIGARTHTHSPSTTSSSRRCGSTVSGRPPSAAPW